MLLVISHPPVDAALSANISFQISLVNPEKGLHADARSIRDSKRSQRALEGNSLVMRHC